MRLSSSRSFLFLLSLVFGLSAVAAAQQSSVRTVFLVRHAERASAAPDSLLSPAGQKRAECLARTLRDAGIKQIFITDVKRTEQTATPLAAAMKLKPTVIPAKDPNTLIRDIAYGAQGNVLVVGHSDTLPFVLARLKAGTITIGENQYDQLFVVNITDGVASPVTTLHYCDCGAAGATPTPAATHKPTSSKKRMKRP
ncbi:MAG TPA: histidine phosphatase family protein [Terriglobales bacterium]|nr:histidine phosphatase family protein [Terriglobales bacterium]